MRGHCSVHHRAIDALSGKELDLYGDRHAGCSIDNNWYGASNNKINKVISITIDELLQAENIDYNKQPVLIKLDVEGVECRALTGATMTIAGISAFIIEDAARNGVSDAVQLAMNELGMSIFSMRNDGVLELFTLEDLLQLKKCANSLQATGLNLVATASDFWRESLRAKH